MTRIRLNQEYRNKIANRMRVHLEQEDTHEKQKYDELKGEQIELNDKAWDFSRNYCQKTLYSRRCQNGISSSK